MLQHGAHFDLVNNDKKTFFNLLKGTPLHEVRWDLSQQCIVLSIRTFAGDQLCSTHQPGLSSSTSGEETRTRNNQPSRDITAVRGISLVLREALGHCYLVITIRQIQSVLSEINTRSEVIKKELVGLDKT